MGLKYEDAGVNKAAGYAEVKLIKELVKRTQNKKVPSPYRFCHRKANR